VSVISQSTVDRQWRRNGFESGGTGPERNWGAQKFFGSLSKISRFGERFCDGQHSFVSFLFAVLLLTVPPCPAICKSGGYVLPRPYGVGTTVDRQQQNKVYQVKMATFYTTLTQFQ